MLAPTNRHAGVVSCSPDSGWHFPLLDVAAGLPDATPVKVLRVVHAALELRWEAGEMPALPPQL